MNTRLGNKVKKVKTAGNLDLSKNTILIVDDNGYKQWKTIDNILPDDLVYEGEVEAIITNCKVVTDIAVDAAKKATDAAERTDGLVDMVKEEIAFMEALEGEIIVYENARKFNETNRISAENTRVTAEIKRQKDTTEAVTECKEVTQEVIDIIGDADLIVFSDPLKQEEEITDNVIVTEFSEFPVDNKVPSEKLVKDSLREVATTIDEKISGKLNTQQGDENINKIMRIGTDGNLFADAESHGINNSFYLSPWSTDFDSSFYQSVSYRFFGNRDTQGNSYLSIGLEKAAIKFATNTNKGISVYVNGVEIPTSFFVGNTYDYVITYSLCTKTLTMYVNGIQIYQGADILIPDFGKIKCNLSGQTKPMQVIFLQKYNFDLSQDEIMEMYGGGSLYNKSGVISRFSYNGFINTQYPSRDMNVNSDRMGVGTAIGTSDGFYKYTSIRSGTFIRGYCSFEYPMPSLPAGAGKNARIHVLDGDYPVKIRVNSQVSLVDSAGEYDLGPLGYNVVSIEEGKSIEFRYTVVSPQCVSNYFPFNKDKAIDINSGALIDADTPCEFSFKKSIGGSRLPSIAAYIGDIAILENGEAYISTSLTTWKKITL